MPERDFLPFFRKHGQPFFQNAGSTGVHQLFRRSAFEVVQRIGGFVCVPLVDFCGSNPVAEGFLEENQRHGNRFVGAGNCADIVPVFVVVAVSALVMEPCSGISLHFSFMFVGTAFSCLIVPRSRDELGRRVFRQIMHQPAVRDSASDSVEKYQIPVAGDGFQVSENVHVVFFLILFCIIFLLSHICRDFARVSRTFFFCKI